MVLEQIAFDKLGFALAEIVSGRWVHLSRRYNTLKHKYYMIRDGQHKNAMFKAWRISES